MHPDLMHEVELGVWKALFIHLIRILESVNGGLVTELDRRSVGSYTVTHCTLHNIS